MYNTLINDFYETPSWIILEHDGDLQIAHNYIPLQGLGWDCIWVTCDRVPKVIGQT